MLKYVLPWALLAASTVTAHAGCAADPDACKIEGGTYNITLPDGEIQGSIVFLHGFGGSGMGTLNNKVWVPVALERGYAVIAPDGMPQRDEVAFLTDVCDDAAARFDLDADKMMLGGFSIGGSMTSYLACAAPDTFHAYVPVAGSFWRPHPTTCEGPVRLLHTHGWTDTTVPLEGARRARRGPERPERACPRRCVQCDEHLARRERLFASARGQIRDQRRLYASFLGALR
ncbi:MAG: hypothetical protein P8Q26_03155 [Ascidiaceihabitans sp.]|nr:hypothetical protein [Ascidiaceihabitans sp.]